MYIKGESSVSNWSILRSNLLRCYVEAAVKSLEPKLTVIFKKFSTFHFQKVWVEPVFKETLSVYAKDTGITQGQIKIFLQHSKHSGISFPKSIVMRYLVVSKNFNL